MPWKIITQDESVGFGNMVRVKCKNVKRRPSSEAELQKSPTPFKLLGFVLLQVIVEDDNGEQLNFKLSTKSGGIQYPKFIVQHAPTWEHPKIMVGAHGRRRQIADVLAEKIQVAGVKEEYTHAEFEPRLKQIVGQNLGEEILDLFAQRFVELTRK